MGAVYYRTNLTLGEDELGLPAFAVESGQLPGRMASGASDGQEPFQEVLPGITSTWPQGCRIRWSRGLPR